MQRIRLNRGTLWAIVGSLTAMGCRDFQDYRTPYKASVQIEFRPIGKDGKLPELTVTDVKNKQVIMLKSSETQHIHNLPLDPNADFVQLTIRDMVTTSTERITIYYQKEAVLISHQCGCAYRYRLKKVSTTFPAEYKIINNELSKLNSSMDVQIYL